MILVLVLSVTFLLNAQVWEEEKKLGEGLDTEITISKENNIHVVWGEHGGGILYRKSTNGGRSWLVKQEISGQTDTVSPDIDIDSNSTIHVVWCNAANGYDLAELHYTKSTDGGESWFQPQQITQLSKHAHMPQMEVDSNDHIHVVWHVHPLGGGYWDEGDREYYYIKSPDGGETWTEPKRLAWGFDHGRKSDTAIDSNDNIYAFWNLKLENDENKWDLYCFKSTDGGESWDYNTIDSFGGRGNDEPSVAIDSNNSLHLVWHGGGWYLYSKSIDKGETWSTPQHLAPIYSSTISIGKPPCITVDSTNNLYVVYQDYITGNCELYYKISRDGGETWTEAIRLTQKLGHSLYPRMAVDSDWVIHLVWFYSSSYPWETFDTYYKRGFQLEKLIEEIQNSDIHHGIKNSLVKKLENAIKSIEKGNINAAINKIEAFQNEVQAQSGKKIPINLAERWIGISESLIQALEDL